jgi:outer membrane receptor protein involved in Fe transport
MTTTGSLLLTLLLATKADPVAPPLPAPGDTPPAAAAEAPAAAPEPAPPPAAAGLRGQVRDRRTGAPVEGVLVLVDGERVATTDEQGRYTAADVAPGAHLVTVAGPQGEEQSQEVSLAPGAVLARDFAIDTRPVETLTIVDKVTRDKREAGQVTLSQEEVKAVPGTFGDPVRVIENLPGTSRAPGGAGGALIVRGANPADSAVMLDGVAIPLLYHFGGLTSVVNSEFLSDVTFLPGGFGAQYGRATAGVAEVQSAPLACERVRASASVDLLDADLYGCVPLGRWRLAAATRRSYIDAFLPSIMEGAADEGESPTVVSPVYFDYQLKAETTRGRGRLQIFAFGSRDSLKVTRATSQEDADFNLGGTLAFHRVQLRHQYFGDRFTLDSSVTPGSVRQAFNEGSADLGSDHRSSADIYTVGWRETATFKAAPGLTLRGGLDHELLHWSADFVTDLPNLARRYPTPLETDARDMFPWHAGGTSIDQAYWAEAIIGLGDQVTVTPGMRVAHLVFDHTRRLVLEPRLAARWQASDDTAFTAAGGLYHKLPDLFSGVMVEGFGQPNLEAERALHLVTGLEQRLGPLEGKLEGFYVRRDHLPSPTDEVEIHDGKAEPVLFRSDGHGRSYGAELLLRLPAQDGRRFSGWVAYTLSRSLRVDRAPLGEGWDQYETLDPATPRLSTLGPAREYLSPFDQTHIMTAVGRWELPWKMSLGFRFQLVSGNPTTPLERGDAYYDADRDSYQVRPGSVEPSSSRLPLVHRLDLRLDKRWQFTRWQLTAYLELMNAYNQRPVEAFGYDYRYRTRTEMKGLPVLPLLGLKGEI